MKVGHASYDAGLISPCTLIHSFSEMGLPTSDGQHGHTRAILPHSSTSVAQVSALEEGFFKG
jgi:hypothetical protein